MDGWKSEPSLDTSLEKAVLHQILNRRCPAMRTREMKRNRVGKPLFREIRDGKSGTNISSELLSQSKERNEGKAVLFRTIF